MTFLAAFVVALAICACGDEPVTSIPVLAELPIFTPCPTGWREVELGGTTVCEPWPTEDPLDCAAFEMSLPGTETCTRIGTPCPADGYPSSPEADYYVDPAAPPGGDGTRAAPFARLGDAVAAATDGDVIALHTGVHRGSVEVAADISIVGACAESTTIEGVRADGLPAAIHPLDATVEIENLRITGDIAGIAIGPEVARAVVEDVIIEDTPGFNVVLTGEATIEVRRSLLSRAYDDDTVGPLVGLREGETADGLGIWMIQNAEAVVEQTVFMDHDLAAAGAGTKPGDVGTLTLRDIATIRSALGVGCGGCFADIERAVFYQTDLGAVGTLGGTVTARDVVVRGTDVATGGGFGAGAGSMTVERVFIDRAEGAGIVPALTASMFVRDVVVHDTVEGDGMGLGGRALIAITSGSIEGERILASNNREVAVAAFDTGSSIDISDVTVVDTNPRMDIGIGVGAYDGARVNLDRFIIDNNSLVGVQVARFGSLDLSNGRVIGHDIGANVQVDDYDVTRLTEGVQYIDNALNLDAAELPVPEATVVAADL